MAYLLWNKKISPKDIKILRTYLYIAIVPSIVIFVCKQCNQTMYTDLINV